VAVVSAVPIVAEFTGHSGQHIELPQERGDPSFVGVASNSIISTANVSAVMLTNDFTTRLVTD
jgi:hypothetical protein